MGQGQPSIIILTTLVVLAHAQTMLPIKFKGDHSIGSGEEDF